MNKVDFKRLFARYLAGELTVEEFKLLIWQLDQGENKPGLREAIQRQLEHAPDGSEGFTKEDEAVLHEVYEALKAKIREQKLTERDRGVMKRTGKRWWPKYGTAAAIALLIAGAFYIGFKKHAPERQQAITAGPADIAPGSNKAVLTLGTGARIVLDSTKKGLVSLQGGSRIIKADSGLLAYHPSYDRNAKVLYNTITIPKGGRYRVVLPDGTRVWLNAASSMRFPSRFVGKVREVSLSGEAYFEVAENAKMPFRVRVKDMLVQVLGTHFNIKAYNEEPAAKVTLLEGSIRVLKGNKAVLAHPGEQIQSAPGVLQNMGKVNLQGVTAWKDNKFWFNDADIHTVMRQLSRWYNVRVVVRGDIPQHFSGLVSRDIYVSEVFEALQATGHIQYKIHNRTIIVSP